MHTSLLSNHPHTHECTHTTHLDQRKTMLSIQHDGLLLIGSYMCCESVVTVRLSVPFCCVAIRSASQINRLTWDKLRVQTAGYWFFYCARLNVKTCLRVHTQVLQCVPFISGEHKYNILTHIQAALQIIEKMNIKIFILANPGIIHTSTWGVETSFQPTLDYSDNFYKHPQASTVLDDLYQRAVHLSFGNSFYLFHTILPSEPQLKLPVSHYHVRATICIINSSITAVQPKVPLHSHKSIEYQKINSVDTEEDLPSPLICLLINGIMFAHLNTPWFMKMYFMDGLVLSWVFIWSIFSCWRTFYTFILFTDSAFYSTSGPGCLLKSLGYHKAR